MDSDSPQIFRSPAKWIVAGEHSVLRGGLALALPVYGQELILKISKIPSGNQPLIGERSWSCQPPKFTPILRTLFDRLQKMGARQDLAASSLIELSSTIPERAGLGSSAALCTAMVRWAFPGESDWFDKARDLENEFHGKSSGLDIAVILAQRPVLFQNGKVIDQLSVPSKSTLADLPITFHSQGQKPDTKECISRVQAWRVRAGSVRSEQLDSQMTQAAQLGWQSLQKTELAEKIQGLAQSMNLAQAVMYEWDLVPPAIQEVVDVLKQKGALGVKLTGAGLGGTIVALWPSQRYTSGF